MFSFWFIWCELPHAEEISSRQTQKSNDILNRKIIAVQIKIVSSLCSLKSEKWQENFFNVFNNVNKALKQSSRREECGVLRYFDICRVKEYVIILNGAGWWVLNIWTKLHCRLFARASAREFKVRTGTDFFLCRAYFLCVWDHKAAERAFSLLIITAVCLTKSYLVTRDNFFSCWRPVIAPKHLAVSRPSTTRPWWDCDTS